MRGIVLFQPLSKYIIIKSLRINATDGMTGSHIENVECCKYYLYLYMK